jgi:O-antigen/teichoic acid export membrane protein
MTPERDGHGAALRRLGRGGLVYGVGGLLNRFLAVLLLPLFTRYLRPEDYGVTSLLATLSIFVGGVASLGVGNALGVFFFSTEDPDQRSGLVWGSASLLLATSLLMFAIGALTAPWIVRVLFGVPGRTDLLLLSLGALAAANVAVPFLGWLRMTERAGHFVMITVITTLVTLGSSATLVVWAGRGVRGVLEAGLIGNSVNLLLSVAVAVRYLPMARTRAALMPLVRAGAPSIIGLGAFFVMDWANRLLLQRQAGLTEVGLYGFGASFGMMMGLLTDTAFGGAWPPFFQSYVGRREEASRLFGLVFRMVLAGFGLIALMFFVGARLVIDVLAQPAFEPAWTVVGMVAAAQALKACFLAALPGIVFARRFDVQAGLEWVGAALCLVLSVLLIPPFGRVGAAAAMLGGYAGMTVATVAAGQRWLHVHYRPRQAWGTVATLVAGGTLMLATYASNVIVDTGVKSVLFAAVCGAVLMFGFSPDERNRARAWGRALVSRRQRS